MRDHHTSLKSLGTDTVPRGIQAPIAVVLDIDSLTLSEKFTGKEIAG